MRTLARNFDPASNKITLPSGRFLAQLIAPKKPAAPPPTTITVLAIVLTNLYLWISLENGSNHPKNPFKKLNKYGTPHRQKPYAPRPNLYNEEGGDVSFRSLLTPHSAWMMFGRFLLICSPGGKV
jgi:hypothetical protein